MSTPAHSLSFEAMREAVESMPPTVNEADRTLVWVDDARRHIEIFIVCDPLTATHRVVGEALQHQVWTTNTGDLLPANRLVLPDAPHFDSVAAFVCAELMENGLADDPDRAFGRSEPVIALALRRAALTNQALVGLAGEVFVLARLVDWLPHRAIELVESWYGSGPSTRDFQLGPIGVEIKTTTSHLSVHHIQGLHQVELGVGVDATPETNLFLLSIGIEWLPRNADSGSSIPELVESILASLQDGGLQSAFLDRVKQYGGDTALGYDHRLQHSSPRYARHFETRFERLYDLRDERLQLLRSEDVAQAVHVEAGSITYRVRLPNKVRGDLNPVAGMSAILTRISQRMDPSGG